MDQSLLLWSLNLALLSVVLQRGISGGMLRIYPLFFGYISFVLASSIVKALVAVHFGLVSWPYYYAFHLPNLFLPIFHLLVLIEVYRIILGRNRIPVRDVLRGALVCAVLSTPVLWEVISGRQGDFYLRWHFFLLVVQVVGCILVYRRVAGERHIELGTNLNGILGGLSLMVALQSLNFGSHLLKSSAFEVFGFLMQFLYFVTLAIFCYSLWNLEPLRSTEAVGSISGVSAPEESETVSRLLIRVLRSLLQFR